MDVVQFQSDLLAYSDHFAQILVSANGDWSLKGFIDLQRKIYPLTSDFTFLLHEKWRIASDQPGSGNTKNIGSVRREIDLMNGNGVFAQHGQATFDDYWINYLTKDMARTIESEVPYHNLNGYWRWRNR